MGQIGVVTATSLNVRTGPSTAAKKINSLPRGSSVAILSVAQSWYEIRAGNMTGYVHGDYIAIVDESPASGYLFEMDALQSVALAAVDQINVGNDFSGEEKKIAKAWNAFGGLISQLSEIVEIDPGCAVAVLCVESSGRGFSADGRMIIRFENHKFWKYWGKQHTEQFGAHFRYKTGEAWKGHEFCVSGSRGWKLFHGKQSAEWEVFDFARSLNETAAMKSISMGLPQIMGFNHAVIGYDSVRQMCDNFQADIRYHVLALFDFLRGAGTTSPMLQALQRNQFELFAAKYNGPGQAAKYGEWMEDHYALFKTLKP